MYQSLDTQSATIIDNFDGANHFLKRFNKDSAASAPWEEKDLTPIQEVKSATFHNHSTLVHKRRLRKSLSELDITSQRLISFAAVVPAMDGSTEKQQRNHKSKTKVPVVAAIFVHAGAGYHSTTNEHLHLEACAR